MDSAFARVRRARADRTGLYQLATLLRASAGVEQALAMLAAGDERLCRFLSDLLRTVLGSEHAAPSTKSLFLHAVPPLVLRAEARARAPVVPGSDSTSTAMAVEVPGPLMAAASAVEACVCDMVTSYFPLRSQEYSRDTEEYSTYLALLDGLFKALELSAPSTRLLPALHGTLREQRHREQPRLRGFITRWSQGVMQAAAGSSAALKTFDALLRLFLDESLDDRATENVRFAIMEKLALPLLWELMATPQGCKACWFSHWPQLRKLADTSISFANIRLTDVQALDLKVQEMACIYAAIEVLFVRTPPDMLRLEINPELGSTPSKDLILTAKKALRKPPGWEQLDKRTLRRCHLRIYAALSASVCATQTKEDLYTAFLLKEELFDDVIMVEPWESREPDLTQLTPEPKFQSFPRPGYSLSHLAAPTGRAGGPARRYGAAASAAGSVTGDASLLGAGLWAATPALASSMTLAGNSASLASSMGPAGASLQQAAMTRGATRLSQNVPEKHRRRLAAASQSSDTASQVASLLAASGGPDAAFLGAAWPLPPGDGDETSLRLLAALAGRGIQPDDQEEEGGTPSETRSTWQTEWLEHDTTLFPEGPSEDCSLALLLVLLRTVDVMNERFGADSAGQQGRMPSWLQALLAAGEKPSANFRLRVLVLRLMVLRAELLRPVLFGRDARVFRFVTSTVLDPRFGAEKKFHYLFRDAMNSLLLPKVGDDDQNQAITMTLDCAFEAKRLLEQLQQTAPHKSTYWQRMHLGLVRMFVLHYMRACPSLQPDVSRIVKQLTAKHPQFATRIQESGLHQLATFLEFGGFDPFAGIERPIETQLKDALLNCVCHRDQTIATYASGVVGLLANWHREKARSLLDDCCQLIESPPLQAVGKERDGGLRLARCAEQVLLECPWALSAPCHAAAPIIGGSRPASGSRRKLFTRMLQLLPTAQTKVLCPLLRALLSLCQDAVQPDEAAAGAAATAAAGAALAAAGHHAWQATGRRGKPERPVGDELKKLRRERLEETLLQLRAGEVWRKALHSKDDSAQLAAAELCCAVAAKLDDEALLGNLGLMLEAEAMLREQSTPDALKHRFKFAHQMLSLCIAVCERRSDVAEGLVAEGVLGFLVRCAILKEKGLRPQEVQDMADSLHSRALTFWEAQLSADVLTRLVEICSRLGGGKAEHEPTFIPAALQLLMALARKGAQYGQKLSKPLADIEFKPMQVSAVSSSWAASGLPQTFQLGATWASALRASMGSQSQTRASYSMSGATSSNQNASVAASLSDDALPHQLRASRRQARPPVPVFGVSTGQGSAAKQAQVASDSHASRAIVPSGSSPIRHSEDSARTRAISFYEKQTKAALKDLERREREGGEEDQAHLVSEYRTGVFPDVEVSVSDILEPLARAAVEDAALAEELLLGLWAGVAPGGGPGLAGAFENLVSGCQGDVALVHFLHSLVMRCGANYGSNLPLPMFQRSLGSSQLSGIQALEELLPLPGSRGVVDPSQAEGGGRHRAVLSALYSASASLGEQPSMAAVVAQLGNIRAFTSDQSAPALRALREGKAEDAEALLSQVLDREAALPDWELQMVSAARLNALEDLMSWSKLRNVLQEAPGAAAQSSITEEERSVRADLGLSILQDEATAKASLDLRLRDAAAAVAQGGLRAGSSAEGIALLATHAISAKRYDDARRLIYEGYDAFAAAWNQLPLLAARARHEALSALPLLRGLEAFAECPERAAPPTRPLSPQHDRFAAWVDSALAKIVVARVRDDKQAEATAYAELGIRCREAGSLAAAQNMMRLCLKSRLIQDHRFYEAVMDLKLLQAGNSCDQLCALIQSEAAKHQDPENALRYNLILAKVAKAGWERRELSHEKAWNAFGLARGISEQCDMAEVAKTHAKLSEFADSVLRRSEEGEGAESASLSNSQQMELASSLVSSVLKVLQLGEAAEGAGDAFRQAHDRLPRVFELLAAMPGCSASFDRGAPSVPPWPFLRWLPQALAHLPKVPALQAPLQALAAKYPQALFWSLQLVSHQDIVGQRQQVFEPLWAVLRQSQAPIHLALKLTQALESLTHPETRFPPELKSFREALASNDKAAAKARWAQLWRRNMEVESREISGQVHVEFAQRLRHKLADAGRRLGLASLVSGTLTDVDLEATASKREAWQKLIQELSMPGGIPATRHARGKAPLELFSPWLKNFDSRSSWLGSPEDQLEVLGQYRGQERPDPRLHARIMRFDPQVLIMPSKQKPKRLKILGSDEREHWFLVKGGEDVRLDERVEQLFGVINSLIAADAGAHLKVRTYAVVPLLPDLGVAEWVRDTRPLKQIVVDTARVKDLNEVKAHKERVEWSRRWGGQAIARYVSIFKLPRADTEVAFGRCVAAMPPECSLKAFFWSTTVGPEAFWHTRQRFAASLAASSAASYLLGIGDRHLDNFLLDLRTSEVVPIDFGYSFGIGALLPVPEMMPFRLTGFLLSALQPLAGTQANGTFRASLEEVLCLCRARAGLLLDACALFIREPLLDWTELSRRKGNVDLEFVPRKRLRYVQQRLQGIHPAAILKEELGDSTVAWVRELVRIQSEGSLEAIAAGLHDPRRKEIYLRGKPLSPAEQADCLIAQATDPNILGRAWEGWAPEI
eukprot:TRINITY_DN24017_c0_g1_i1.p1 TRINITY_DN24017_c0_g1~~TRINITY_DN24017_c0_g1_i1.p1  ORF type:complete len:2972 (-),score=592.94 TRINITY_DN24017_c0_g1_i1:290-8146(-)